MDIVTAAIFLSGVGLTFGCFFLLAPSQDTNLGRGVSGLPFEETPSLIGASRAHIECDANVDNLAYWNDPQGQRDTDFKSPFVVPKKVGEKTKYISFAPDLGGWNNIRMSLENVFVFALATGRTLIIPPPYNMYLLDKNKNTVYKGFADFFPLETDRFQKRLPTMSTEEFLRLEGGPDGQFPIPKDKYDEVMKAAPTCERWQGSKRHCNTIENFLSSIAYTPQLNSTICMIFDENKFNGEPIPEEIEKSIEDFCLPNRQKNKIFMTKEIQEKPIIHIRNEVPDYRILANYYGWAYFTNPATSNFYKRFVRDFLHYHDQIYCAAGKIVNSLQDEGKKRGFELDEEGGGGFSSLHIRRGDFQFEMTKISAQEWYDNLDETWKENEILYIATDERNKTFFDDLKAHHDLRFLDDYWDMAGLGDLNPDYMGMIDTIVASKGRVFGGTYFSTFTGYINRMRGYNGMSMKDTYYGYLPYKNDAHEWRDKDRGGTAFSFEWPDGWVGIDGDKDPAKSKF